MIYYVPELMLKDGSTRQLAMSNLVPLREKGGMIYLVISHHTTLTFVHHSLFTVLSINNF